MKIDKQKNSPILYLMGELVKLCSAPVNNPLFLWGGKATKSQTFALTPKSERTPVCTAPKA
ncbi:hypothetical protein OGM63_19290 [Plectonema radiosum NIES-515]|uniref:Transposase n=1 Tax=Plectonema radiosum NIES-515 TaxID=2986073 RepID=A0ABT3B2M3_9CYAN|nr:hypothetical protein [Plectonema radiosum]MCV3215631.1 hypothetical protein [Plectonema radiosum NIES-515]